MYTLRTKPAVSIEQFFLGCLVHASYLVSSEGVAAVIDPQHDVDIYLDVARDKGLTRISSPDIMNSQHAPERASISATVQARSSRT